MAAQPRTALGETLVRSQPAPKGRGSTTTHEKSRLAQQWRLGVACARDPRLQKSCVAVLMLIASHVNRRTGEAYPSVTRLADLAGISTRTAQRGIRQLVALGYLLEKRVPGRTTRYRLADSIWVPCTTPASDVAQGASTSSEDHDTLVPRGVTPVSPEPALEPAKDRDVESERRRAISDVVSLPLPFGLAQSSWSAYVLLCERQAGAARLTVDSGLARLREIEALAAAGYDADAVVLQCVAECRPTLVPRNQPRRISPRLPAPSADALFLIAAARLQQLELGE